MKSKIDERIEKHVDAIIAKPELSPDDLSTLIFLRRELCAEDERKEDIRNLVSLMGSFGKGE